VFQTIEPVQQLKHQLSRNLFGVDMNTQKPWESPGDLSSVGDDLPELPLLRLVDLMREEYRHRLVRLGISGVGFHS